MRVTVAIATLRRPDRLAGCLDHLAALSPRPAEVLVVDGDPQRSAEPATRAAAARHGLPVTYLAGPLGLTRQRNVALDAATGDVVVFLDDDAWLEPDALAALTPAYASPDVVGATGRVDEVTSHRIGGQRSVVRRVLAPRGRDGTFMRCGYPRRMRRWDAPADVETMSGCFMSARTDVARAVRFDERLPGYALAEDEDFSYRLSRRGRIAYVPTAVVHHDNTGFGTRDRVGFNRTVVVHRHYLFRKNFPQTPAARGEFALLLVALVVHRLLNADARGAWGVVVGIGAVARGHGPD